MNKDGSAHVVHVLRIDSVFNVVADLNQRPKWIDGVIGVEDISTKLQQVGTGHNCIMPDKSNYLITSYFARNNDSIILEETDKRKMGTCQILLERLEENKTRMTFNFFMKDNIILPALFNLFMKKKLAKSFEKSQEKLEQYLQEDKKMVS